MAKVELEEVTLTDTQIALLIKAALDNNAYLIQFASFVYGQDFKPHVRKRIGNDFLKAWKNYEKIVKNILEEGKND